MLFRSEDDQADDTEEAGEDDWDEGEKYNGELDEVLGKSDPAGKWIHDFVHSKNPKFAGKSKAERQKMALGAYYAAQRAEATDYTNVQKTMKSLQDAYVAMQQPVNESAVKESKTEEISENVAGDHSAAGMTHSADRKSTRLNSSHTDISRMPSSA